MEIWDIPVKCREKCFTAEIRKHRSKFSTELVKSLSVEIDIQSPLGPGSEQLAMASPALTKGLDQTISSRGAWCSQSVILKLTHQTPQSLDLKTVLL